MSSNSQSLCNMWMCVKHVYDYTPGKWREKWGTPFPRAAFLHALQRADGAVHVTGSKSARHGRSPIGAEPVPDVGQSVAAVERAESHWLAALPRSAGRRLQPDQGETQRPQETHLLQHALSAAANWAIGKTSIGLSVEFIMRLSSVGGGRILRCTLSVRLSVCLSVCPSVRPSRYCLL